MTIHLYVFGFRLLVAQLTVQLIGAIWDHEVITGAVSLPPRALKHTVPVHRLLKEELVAEQAIEEMVLVRQIVVVSALMLVYWW